MNALLAVGVTAAIILTGSGPATAHSASPVRVSVQTAGTTHLAAPVKKPAKGALRIRITGLPPGVRPQVRVRGPGRYRKTVKRTGTLKTLTPGVYRVATPRVSTPAGSAAGEPSKRRVKVKPGRTVRVAANYVWTASPTTARAPDTTAPGKVTALTAGQRTQDSIPLSWTNPTDTDLAAIIVRRAKGDTAPATPTDGTGITLGSPIATTVTDTGLDPDTSYSYAVFTRDTTGNTSGPATLTTTPPDTAPPGTVTALAAGQRTPDSIALSWTNPTDTDLATIIVRRAKGDTAPATPTDGTGVTPGSPTATGVTDTSLDPDTTYSYAVFTRDTTGNTSGPATLTTATTAIPKISSVFNYPKVGQPDPAIRNKLVQLLDQVPSGAQVSASFFIIYPDYPVVDALIDAHARGATVRVVLDSGYRQSTATNQAIDAAFALLADELGSDPGAPSFAMQCDQACISKEEDSIQHNKFVLMSTSGDQSDLVFQTTANMSTTGSGEAEWNAAVVSSGNPELYDSYEAYFADLAARPDVPGNNYNAVRPPATYGTFTPHYFPRTDGIDTVAQTLASVNCTGSTEVDVMATHFVRTAVRDRLNEMARVGCRVRVIARADNISREMCDSLVAQAVTVRVGDAPSASKVGIHGKYLTVSGGADNRHLVWMGSHNLTNNALLRNDETFLLIDDQDVHDAFHTNFGTIWADPSMTPGCAKVL